MSIVEANAFLGHKDRALEWLERAYKEKDSTLYWIKGDPLLRTLEQHRKRPVITPCLRYLLWSTAQH
ncbi:MAG: hypothetical protein JWP44_4969 [Mucilaginibacter sp.]|nr:hypothetical protein [Mucilaginibacter sp.]